MSFYPNPFINQFPYMDAHEMNLDWIIREVKRIATEMKAFTVVNKISYADPIDWNITSQYEAFKIVYDDASGRLMISKQPVPKGISIDNEDYWTLVSPFKIDDELSDSSLNPLSNRTITSKFNSIDSEITDLHDTDDSLNQGIYNEIEARQEADNALGIRIDTTDANLSQETSIRTSEDASIRSDLSDLTDALNEETSNREASESVLSSRISAIASLPSGSTSGDAELIDIRVGANGETYDSAGDAVRDQFELVNNDISDISSDITNNYVEDSGRAILDDGSIAARTSYRMALYKVEPNTRYFIKNPDGEYLKIGSSATLNYTQTLTDVETPDDDASATFTTSSNAQYMYVVFWTNTAEASYTEALASLKVYRISGNDLIARKDIQVIEGKYQELFNDALSVNENLYDPSTYCMLGYGMDTDGRIIGNGAYTDRCVVHLLPLDGLSYITIAVLSNVNTGAGRYCWYDANKAPIIYSGETPAIGGYPAYGVKRASYLEIPSSAKYISFMLMYASCDRDSDGYPKCMITASKAYPGYKPYETIEVDDIYTQPKDIYVCAHDSDEKYRNGCNYFCSGVNDELTIQEALDSVGSVGTLWLAPGTYNIDSIPLQDDGQYVAIQYKTMNNGGIVPNRVRIRCYDQTPMREIGYSEINHCATLKVSANCYSNLSDSTNYSIIGVENDGEGGRNWNGACFDISGVGICIPGNQKKIVAFDAWYAFCIVMERCMATAIPTNGMPDAAGNEDCIGIKCTSGSNFGQCSNLTSCAMYGFGQGIAVSGEHYVLNNCKTIYNKYGFTFNWYGSNNAGYCHPNTLINCCSEMDFNYPYFGYNGQVQSVTLIDFNMEYRQAAAALGGMKAQERVPGTWRGDIHFTVKAYGSEGYSGGNEVGFAFWEAGHGKNVHTVNDAQKQIVTTSERNSYAPNEMQRVYDTTLGKFFTYVNGSWIEG